MNEVIQNILTRRSIRDFSEKLVSKEDVEVLIKAGLYAPSGMSRQTWKFIGVLNQDIIAKLASTVGEICGRDDYCFYHAKALIIISNDKESVWGRDDNACALQNIFLAGHSMGIGSVWINQLNGNADHPEVRAILDTLGVPESHTVYGIAALGYAVEEAKGMIDKVGTFTIVE